MKHYIVCNNDAILEDPNYSPTGIGSREFGQDCRQWLVCLSGEEWKLCKGLRHSPTATK